MTNNFIVDGVFRRGDVAYISFRDLGTLIYDGDFTFPTRILNDQELSKLETAIIQNNQLQAANIRSDDVKIIDDVFNKSYLHVLQLKAPLAVAPIIRKIPDFWRTRKHGIFETTHILEQLRSYVAMQLDLFSFPSDVVDVFYTSSELSDSIQVAWDQVKGLRGRKRQEAIQNYVDPVMNSIKEYLKSLNPMLKEYDMHLAYYEKNHEVEIHADSLDGLEYVGFITPEQIRNCKIAFIDTENPLFKHEGSQTSWVGLAFYGQQKPVRKVIFSLHPLDITSIPGRDIDYEIISGFDSYSDLEQAVSEEFIEERPLFIIGQNVIWYDFRKMKIDSLADDGEFELFLTPEEKAKVKATVLKEKKDQESKERFYEVIFQRIGTDRVVVIDTYQISRPGLSYLRPVQSMRLANILNHLLPNLGFEKSISYEEMEELEFKFEGRDMRAGNQIATYLASDIDDMVPLIFDQEMQYQNTGSVSPFSFDDFCELASRFRIDFEKLLYSPNAMDYYYKRKFFENIGTYFDSIYPFNRDIHKLNRSRKGKFEYRVRKLHSNSADTVTDLPEQTIISLFPWPDYLAELWLSDRLRRDYPDFATFLIEHKYAESPRTDLTVDKGYTIRDDPRRQLFLTQYMRTFMMNMIYDYAAVLLDDEPHSKARNVFYARYGFDPEVLWDTIERKITQAIENLNEIDRRLTKTNYDGQFAFIDAPTATFEEIYQCGVIPLMRVCGELV